MGCSEINWTRVNSIRNRVHILDAVQCVQRRLERFRRDVAIIG
jgi:hypothetical protein